MSRADTGLDWISSSRSRVNRSQLSECHTHRRGKPCLSGVDTGLHRVSYRRLVRECHAPCYWGSLMSHHNQLRHSGVDHRRASSGLMLMLMLLLMMIQ